MTNLKNTGMFDSLFNAPDEGAEDEAYAFRQAQLTPFEQMSYANALGARTAGRGLGQVVGTMAGADTRSEAQKIAEIRSAMAQSGVQNGTEAWYEALIAHFNRAGLADAAARAQLQLEALRDRNAQRTRNEAEARRADAMAEKALRVSPRDRMLDKYWEFTEKLQAQGEFQDPTLVQARDNLARALGIKPEQALKESADWTIVPPTQYSPGYKINRRTGETQALGGRIPGAKEAPPAADDSPFADLSGESRKAAERAAGKEVGEWVSGGRASAVRGVEALRDVQEKLRANPDLVNDPLSSQLPDWSRSMTAGGRAAIDARDTVRTAIQATLRQTLGAQFTQKEADQMFQRAWDSRLGVDENLERLGRAIQELEDQIAARDSLSRGRRPAERAPREPRGDVRVRLPDGRVGTIPRSKLAEAKSKGAVEIK